MRATQILHERGQSLWLDNITRGLHARVARRNLFIEIPGTAELAATPGPAGSPTTTTADPT